MIETPSCPVCQAVHWREIGRRAYDLASVRHASPYLRARFRVLFEVWFPGCREVTLTSLACQQCGFVSYAPRPETDDIDRKYRFLAEQGLAGLNVQDADDPVEQRRAREIYQEVRPRLPRGRQARVLDFGGADGRLMRDFLAAGAACYLIDYSTRVYPGVTRLGDTERDLPEGEAFDAIICSHVIEHVADPLAVVGRLAKGLAADGVIYIGVPLEIWKRAPLHEEPVTHVNFFNVGSMRRLLQNAGLDVLSCYMTSHLHPSGRPLPAVSAIGRPVRSGVNYARLSNDGVAETERLLAPGLAMKVKRQIGVRAGLAQAVGNKVRATIGGWR